MKCIVGLGNPGRKYAKTRHNIGFMVIDELLNRKNLSLNKSKFNGKYVIEGTGQKKVLLLQPQTFMNASGEAIRPLLDYYQIEPCDLVVAYDDLDLPIGKIRLRENGGHGGHNGIRSIIDHLGTKDFKRLRIGVGRPISPVPVVDYVLGTFPKKQQDIVETAIHTGVDVCESWLDKPFLEVMNEYNS